MIVTSYNSKKLAKKVARKLGVPFVGLKQQAFPDGEMHLTYNNTKAKVKHVIIIESFQPDPNETLLRVCMMAEGARQNGAKKVMVVAPYLGFMRQDKMFCTGDVQSNVVMGQMLSLFADKLVTIDPHLHRVRSLKEVFKCKTLCLSANDTIAAYIKRKFKKPVIIGPDWESYQWAEAIAAQVGCDSTVLEKTRYSGRKVSSKLLKPVDLKGKDCIIVDDIISTGHTMVEAMKKAKGARSVHAIGVHGLFVENALKKMSKFDSVLCTNTIERENSKIDVSDLIAQCFL